MSPRDLKKVIHGFSVNRGEFGAASRGVAALKSTLANIGFPSQATRRALVACYELAMNIVIHATSGEVTAVIDNGRLEVTARDVGPGIADIELAMQDGYSTAPPEVREMGFGAGMGLPNTKRVSDELEVDTRVGYGTTVRALIVPKERDLVGPPYFHSVRLDSSRCKGCTNCIKGCPTEAIRVRAGKALILEDRCVDCGECIRRCPNQAKFAASSSWEDLDDYDYRVALIPPSFYGQFGGADPGKVAGALLGPGGFDEVFNVARAADLASRLMREYVEKTPRPRPLISPACPVILRLIQVKFPSLLDHVIPCEAPMEIAAWMVKTRLSRELSNKKVGVFFITPCPAKVTASRQPVGRGRSLVDGTIPVSRACLWVREHLDQAQPVLFPDSTGLGMGWGRSGGEMAAVGVSGLAVDGISAVSSVFEEIEKGQLQDIDFIEAQACTGGCVGGPLTVENPFVARLRIRTLAVKHRASPPDPAVLSVPSGEPSVWFTQPLLPRPVYKLDEDPDKASEMRARIDKVESELPGLDCGACGAPTCRALAEDAVLGRGSVWDCVFKLREKLQELSQEVTRLSAILPPAMGGGRSAEGPKGPGEEPPPEIRKEMKGQ